MEYKVTFDYFAVAFVTARNEKEAIQKARKGLGRIKISGRAEAPRVCAGTWKKDCKNPVHWSDETECDSCRYDREQDRINTPG